MVTVIDIVPLRVLAREFYVSERTIRRWVSQAKLPPPVRLGRSPLWRLEEIQKWLAAGGMKPPVDPPNGTGLVAGGAA